MTDVVSAGSTTSGGPTGPGPDWAARQQWLIGAGTAVVGLLIAIAVILALVDNDERPASASGDEPDLGKSFTIAATQIHPALTAYVDAMSVTKSATPGVRVERKHHLVAVHVAVTNDGVEAWSGTLTHSVLVAHHGRSFRPDARFTDVQAGAAWPAQFQLAGGRTHDAYLVFDLPNGLEPKELELRVGPGADDTATWALPGASPPPIVGPDGTTVLD